MSRKHYHVVGVPTFAPSAPPRLEFSNFVKDEDVRNLYLLALASIQNDKEDKLTSFFQIGGLPVFLIVFYSFFLRKSVDYRHTWKAPYTLG